MTSRTIPRPNRPSILRSTPRLFGFANDQVAPAGCNANPPANNQVGCGSVLYNFAIPDQQPVAYYSVGLYFQDEYRVNSKLKFTLTLRADRNSGGTCQSSCASLPATPFNDTPHGGTIPYDESFLTGNKTIIPGYRKGCVRAKVRRGLEPNRPKYGHSCGRRSLYRPLSRRHSEPSSIRTSRR